MTASPTTIVAAAAARGQRRRHTAASTISPSASPRTAGTGVRPEETERGRHDEEQREAPRGASSRPTTQKIRRAERREERRDQAPRQLLLVPVVEDEVVRQVGEAGPVRIAELLREVVGRAVGTPPVEVDRVCVDEPPSGHRRRGPKHEPARGRPSAAATGAPEEVRADSGEVAPERVGDRLVRRVAAERGLRDQRVEDDDRGERKSESRPRAARRTAAASVRSASNATLRERDEEEHVLPSLDRGQRVPVHACAVEPVQHGVVQCEPDDEEVEGDDRTPPDDHRRASQGDGVDDERRVVTGSGAGTGRG